MGSKVIPIILAGGVGTRLWPLSRETFPKQFLRLISQNSLLQDTVLRVQSLADIQQSVIVCNVDHYSMSHDHLKEINASGFQFLLEPFGKNTAPAIACAAQYIIENIEDDSILLVLPSDHYIADQELFYEAVCRAKTIAKQGFLVTFGVVPSSPETGYGYIQAGEQISIDTYKVNQFIGKPQLESAKQFIEEGNFYWNSGMFMFRPQVYLEELKKASPDIYYAAMQAVEKGEKKDDYLSLNSEMFASCPSNSIDYAVMETTDKAVVIPLASSWNDLGCWAAVAKSNICDRENNVTRGDVLIKDSKNCFISSEGQMVAVLGLKDQVVVTTADVILVADKSYSQDVKYLVHQLKSHNSHLVAYHKKQYDFTGYTESLTTENDFTVEHIMLKPCSKLFLPASPYPVHWVVVSGAAEITINHQIHEVLINHSLSVGKQLECDLKNLGDQPAHLIRIQLKSPTSIMSKNISEATV